MDGPSPDDPHQKAGFTQLGFPKLLVKNLVVGKYAYYDDPDGAEDFEAWCVLYHFPFFGDRLVTRRGRSRNVPLRVSRISTLQSGKSLIHSGYQPPEMGTNWGQRWPCNRNPSTTRVQRRIPEKTGVTGVATQSQCNRPAVSMPDN